MSDLDRLFARSPTKHVSPLEDFTTAALAIAIRHDVEPFKRVVNGVAEDRWRTKSGRPGDLTDATLLSVDDQAVLWAEGLDGGRLDLVVNLRMRDGSTETLWIEVKIDAAITERAVGCDQLDVYLKHRDLREPPKPTLLTLDKTGSLRDDITGIAWTDIVAAVEATPDCDRSWKDLVAFLGEQLVVLPPLPKEPVGVVEVLPVFKAVNEEVKRLWRGEVPSNLHSLGVERFLTMNREKEHRYLLSAGPLYYGLRPIGDRWEWWIAIATGNFFRIPISPEAIWEAARSSGRFGAWTYRDDRNALLEQRRPYVPGDPGAVIEWLSCSIREVHDSGVLRPFIEKWREKREADAARNAERARAKATRYVGTADGGVAE